MTVGQHLFTTGDQNPGMRAKRARSLWIRPGSEVSFPMGAWSWKGSSKKTAFISSLLHASVHLHGGHQHVSAGEQIASHCKWSPLGGEKVFSYGSAYIPPVRAAMLVMPLL